MFTDPDVTSYIHFKCMVGDHFTVTNILKNDVSKVHCLDGRLSVPPLFYACRYGHLKVCEVLIDSGADVRYSRQGWTPLHEACSFNHVDIVKWLLAQNANPDVMVSWSGMTPLMHAARRNFLGVCDVLIGGGDANVWQRNLDGHTALDLTDDTECQELLAREMKKVLLRQAWESNCVDFLPINVLSEDLFREVLSFV